MKSIGRPGLRVAAGALTLVALLAITAPPWSPLLARRSRLDLREPSAASPHSPSQAAATAHLPIYPGQSWADVDDASRDGWTSEIFSQKADKVLEQLGPLIVHPQRIDVALLWSLAAEDFQCGRLLPRRLETAFEDGALEVQRAVRGGATLQADGASAYRGPSGLGEVLRELAAPFRNAENVHYKFKVYRVEPSTNDVTTRQYLAISGQTPEGILEQNASWVTRWAAGYGDGNPLLLSISVVDFEQVTARQSNQPWFVDCTQSVLGGNRCYGEQFLLGMNHWLARMQDTRYFAPLGNPGLAVGDVNGDGLDDLYVCQEAGLPNRLFLQRADGTAVDRSEEWGCNWLESSRSALLVDLDNDGDQDLVVAIIGGVLLAENDRRQRFRVQAVLATDDDTMSLCAADYDHDGDLDLYVCVDYPNDYFAQSPDISVLGGASNRVYHDANNAGRNSLFRNDMATHGPWRFTDVTNDVGMDANNRRFSLAAAWEDFDNDGDQDLYVANDFGRNNLYRNDQVETGQVRFVDVAYEAQVEDPASGMSVAWGDVDRDGQMDLYVGNMFSAAGGRISFQHAFKADATPEIKARLQRFARGNTLLYNRGHGLFRDISEDAAVTVGRWAWGSNFVDINNDGWEDIVVANGYITAEDPGDL